MNFLQFCSVFFLLFHVTNAKSMYVDLAGGSNSFNQEYKTKFLKNVNILNKLHAELSNLSHIPEEITTESFEANAGQDPMKNPYLFEGDINLSDEQWDILIENAREELRARGSSGNDTISGIPKKRAVLSDPSLRWTFPIPLYMEPAVNANLIMSVIRKYEAETCIRFQRHNQPVNDSVNSITFTRGWSLTVNSVDMRGCSSFLGRSWKYRPQPVSIDRGCEYFGIIWHEIAHALGVEHEQSRSDRDNYVRIDFANILKGYWQNFEKFSANALLDYGVPYDYGSVMHYGPYDVAIDTSRPTIITRDRVYTDTPGTRVGPSFYDVKGINLAYCRSTCTNTLRCVNGGYPNPSNCKVCNCPRGFGGKLCDVTAAPLSGCGRSELTATASFQKLSESGGKTCYYLITAPVGKRVFFKVTDLETDSSHIQPCALSYLEINFTGYWSESGARTCFIDRPLPISHSIRNQLLVIYQGINVSSFSMNYRFE